ncbi:hypothetical protein HNY73_000053 [Argiope bruennichi]|uniref:Uncharacterized protein n=1 Tax=Argiope bruennichi TaxID=94029 RepID=A0A8T0FWQ6_ARGBR|nr:hypothetical protein HNY73_000053 [Argiope bruennichi]
MTASHPFFSRIMENEINNHDSKKGFSIGEKNVNANIWTKMKDSAGKETGQAHHENVPKRDSSCRIQLKDIADDAGLERRMNGKLIQDDEKVKRNILCEFKLREEDLLRENFVS